MGICTHIYTFLQLYLSPWIVNPALISSEGIVVTSFQGDQVMFNCTADGHPLPKIVWRRNGQLVLINPSVPKFELQESPPSPGFRVEEISNVMQVTSTLIVNQVSSTDEGTYSCRADNEGGVGAIMEVPYELFVMKREYHSVFHDFSSCAYSITVY